MYENAVTGAAFVLHFVSHLVETRDFWITVWVKVRDKGMPLDPFTRLLAAMGFGALIRREFQPAELLGSVECFSQGRTPGQECVVSTIATIQVETPARAGLRVSRGQRS